MNIRMRIAKLEALPSLARVEAAPDWDAYGAAVRRGEDPDVPALKRGETREGARRRALADVYVEDLMGDA